MARANESIPASKDILCAEISLGDEYYSEPRGNIEVKLYIGFTEKEYDNFIKKLDVEYNAGYGGQELFGIIWLKDGTWMDRGEYDGAEWWQHQKCPKIPVDLELKNRCY